MRRCLIIEDDAKNAEYVATGLRQLGYGTSVCNDGGEGLQRATGETWDVIVLNRLRREEDSVSIIVQDNGRGFLRPS